MNETRKCPECFGDIDGRATKCKHCGASVKLSSTTWKVGTMIMALGLLILIGGLLTDWLFIAFGLTLMGIGAFFRIYAK